MGVCEVADVLTHSLSHGTTPTPLTVAAGLPVGLQIVGPPGADALVLAEAAAFEAAHTFCKQVPRDVRVGVAV